MRNICGVLIFAAFLQLARAQAPTTVLLWPNGAPRDSGDEDWDEPPPTPFPPV